MTPPQTVTAAAAPPTPMLPPKLTVGINYPWPGNNYGYWIGPHIWDTRYPPVTLDWPTRMPINLESCYDAGARVVRLFLLCNGNNYGKPKSWGKTKPAWDTDGKTFCDYKSNNYYEFDPPDPLDPQFASDFKQALDIFQALKQKGKLLQLIPVFIDFSFGEYGKVAIFFDQNKQTKFLDKTFDPLLNVSKPYKDQIYAWEVMNEPTWMIRKISPPLSYTNVMPIIDEESMKKFLKAAIKKIEDAGFASTVGHRYLSDLNTLPAGSKPQFHYYGKYVLGDDTRSFPNHTGAPDAFVGEIDSSPTGHGALWSDCQKGITGPKRDDDPANCVFERLAVVARKGYGLALLWPNQSAMTDQPHFTKAGLEGLKRFTTGLYPNGIPAAP